MNLLLAIIGFAIFVLLYSYLLTHYIPKRLYSFLNIFMALGSIMFGLVLGLSLSDMGLGQAELIKGILVGAIIMLPITLTIGLVLLIPGFRHIFTDQPAKLVKKRSMYYELGFRIPFGTAFSEEILFRGVLLGLMLNRYNLTVAIISSSVVFGLWHIAPTWKTLRSNIALKELVGEQRKLHGLSIFGAVVSTACAGAAFALLRNLSGSVVAAWIAHSAINGFSVAGGLIAHRLHLKSKLKQQ